MWADRDRRLTMWADRETSRLKWAASFDDIGGDK